MKHEDLVSDNLDSTVEVSGSGVILDGSHNVYHTHHSTNQQTTSIVQQQQPQSGSSNTSEQQQWVLDERMKRMLMDLQRHWLNDYQQSREKILVEMTEKVILINY